MAPWWWFPCKPKHVGTVFLILKCFNNSTFFNVVCFSWKLKCWKLLMHGVTMEWNELVCIPHCIVPSDTQFETWRWPVQGLKHVVYVIMKQHTSITLTTDEHPRVRAALQTGRSRVGFSVVSLEFFVDIILPAPLWGWLSLRNEYQVYFLGDKGGRCVELTTVPPSYAECPEIWESQPPGALTACPGL